VAIQLDKFSILHALRADSEQSHLAGQVLALFGHGAFARRCPLLGVKLKSDFGAARSAFDPTETSLGAAAELDTFHPTRSPCQLGQKKI
jgi:hypothetical protein